MFLDPPDRAAKKRTGAQTVEFLLILPPLLALVVAAVEFSLMVAVEQKLAAASAVGARVAAQGGNQVRVEEAVRAVLGEGALAKAAIRARLTDDRGNPLPAGADVVVVVSIPAPQAVPDLLGFIGLSLQDVTLSGRTLLRKE